MAMSSDFESFLIKKENVDARPVKASWIPYCSLTKADLAGFINHTAKRKPVQPVSLPSFLSSVKAAST